MKCHRLVFFITLALTFTVQSAPLKGHVEDNESPAVTSGISSASSIPHVHGVTSEGVTVDATFVRLMGRSVCLRSPDGRLIVTPMERLTSAEQSWVMDRQNAVRRINEQLPTATLVRKTGVIRTAQGAPAKNSQTERMRQTFAPFVQSQEVTLRSDSRYLYVESRGMPNHPMMIGIRSWQQQVPLPQKYTGNNAWQIPLHPQPAAEPASTRNRFLRGAIALAVNGIPIFNPLNNRGDDAFLAGELDEYGGHCGRADDYHYHLPPVHLQQQAGKGAIIAWALDGYPIYGFEEPDGSKVTGLDELNGHQDADGQYHYHATKTYPYLNGGFYGEVTERDDQVDPQPRAESPRPALTPLRDASITDFRSTAPGSFLLTYEVRGKQGSVSYSVADNGSVMFVFVDTDGDSTTETYESRRRGPGGGGGDRRPPPRDENKKPPRNDRKKSRDEPRDQKRSDTSQEQGRRSDRGAAKRNGQSSFLVSSDAVNSGGFLLAEFTCDGASASPPVSWQGAPKGTKSFAISLWHTAPDQEKSYWLIYNIPANVMGVPKNVKDIGTMGLNDRKRPDYDPMCSKGPGVKDYHLTVYALSEELKLPPSQATRAGLLDAIQKITLAENTFTFQYQRKE